AARPAAAVPPSDAWLEGYAAAVLERELQISAPSLRVREGVLSLSAGDLPAADEARVQALLGGIRGVTRVEIIPVAAPATPTVAVAAPAPPATTEAAPPPEARVLADWQTGLLPGGALFKPLVADPRWPHFAASYQNYQRDPTLRDVGAVSFGETFALL